MLNTVLPMTDTLYQYLADNSLRETPLLKRLREETEAHPRGSMQISADQGQFMALLVKLAGARNIIEIGTFTGYSALWMTEAMPGDGRLVACDVSEEFTAIARRYWAEAGLSNRIHLHLAPAAETLEKLLAESGAGHYDMAFIDADKTGYDLYYEQCLILLRSGGLIMIDNTLWDGRVADPRETDADTEAIRALNKKLHHDDRIELAFLAISDGLTLARKR